MINVKTQIRLTASKRNYEVLYSYDNGGTYHLHKSGLTLDQANKEAISIKGHIKLLRDVRVR